MIEGRRKPEGVVIAMVARHKGAHGIQTHVRQVVTLLTARNQSVRVVHPGSWVPFLGEVLLAPGRALRRTRLGPAVRLDRYWRRLVLERALRREMRRHEPVVVYAQDPRSAHAALRARKPEHTPVVMAVHYNESQAQGLIASGKLARGGAAERAIRAFEADLIPRLQGLVFVSDHMRSHTYEVVPEAQGIPSAVIPNFLHPLDRRPVTDESPLRDCITVGALELRKNHSYLLHVLAEARRNGSRHTLTVVGDGPERGSLEKLATRLEVSDDVIFTGSRTDVDRLLQQHRVYVHSATMENCPFALLEAFRAGLPVVAAPVGGIPGVVGSDGAARLWDLADPAGGAHVLADLLNDESVRTEAAARALNRFQSVFAADVVGEQLLGFLTDVASRPTGR